MALTKVTYSMIQDAAANIVDFGADPTGVADSSSAIQAAIDASDYIYIPDGTFLISTALEIDRSGVTILGANKKSSVLKTTTAIKHLLITGGSIVKGVSIQNVGFVGDAISSDFVQIETSFVDVLIDNCDFLSSNITTPIFASGAGIKLTGSFSVANNLSINQCTFQGLNYGVIEDATNVVSLSIINCIFTDVYYYGVGLTNADITNLSTSLFEYCNKNNASPGAAVNVAAAPGNTNQLYVQGCHFENNGGTGGGGIDMALNAGRGHVIRDNNFNGSTAGAAADYAIFVGAGTTALIEGNTFIEHTSGFLNLSTSGGGALATVIANFPYDNSGNPSTTKMFVSGSGNPLIYLDNVNNIVKTTSLRTNNVNLNGAAISEYATNAAATIDVNFDGYNGGTTQFRSVKFYNGKNGLQLFIDGPNNKAIFSTGLRFSGLPTSSAGLVSGDVWNNAGVLNIIP